MLRERGETNIPPEDSLRIAEAIKEDYSYVCPDIVKEFKKYDQEPSKYFKKYDGIYSVTGKVKKKKIKPKKARVFTLFLCIELFCGCRLRTFPCS